MNHLIWLPRDCIRSDLICAVDFRFSSRARDRYIIRWIETPTFQPCSPRICGLYRFDLVNREIAISNCVLKRARGQWNVYWAIKDLCSNVVVLVMHYSYNVTVLCSFGTVFKIIDENFCCICFCRRIPTHSWEIWLWSRSKLLHFC